jgi:DNA-binding CsgD family transcriptional regulator
VSERISDRIVGSVRANRSRPAGISSLTDRELDVFRCLGHGMGTAKIAGALGISHKTVETHRARLKKKLGVDSVNALVARAARWVREAG